MLKKTISYTDFDGEAVKEDCYFNLTKAELLALDKAHGCELEKRIRRMAEEENTTEMALFFQELILRSYGKKSDDGKRFIKSEQLSTEFSQSLAFDELFDQLTSDEKEAAAFVEGITAGVRVPAKK